MLWIVDANLSGMDPQHCRIDNTRGRWDPNFAAIGAVEPYAIVELDQSAFGESELNILESQPPESALPIVKLSSSTSERQHGEVEKGSSQEGSDRAFYDFLCSFHR